MSPARSPAQDPDKARSPSDEARPAPAIDPGSPGPVLRGRDEALSQLSDTLDQVRSGAAGAVTLIEGVAGIGKSRLLDEATRMARRLHFAVGRGGAEPGEAVELAPLMDALFTGNPPPLKPAALLDLPAVHEQRYWLLQEPQALLERAALERPILLALDDLQWADAGTASALRVLTSRLTGLPVAWLIALRPPQHSSRISETVQFLEGTGANRLTLGPLDEGAALQIGRDMTGATPGETFAALIARAQGNPFLLTEILTGLREEDRFQMNDGHTSVADAATPARVHVTMRERLARLPDPARHAAVVAASLGRTFSFGELAAMLASPATAALAPVEQLVDAWIFIDRDGDLAFRHDITRDAVRESVPSSARRALDRQAVDVLVNNGAQPAEVATQLAESAAHGDDAAVATLSTAAKALGAYDPSGAADLTRRALELATANSTARPELVTETAVLLHAAGRGEEGWAFIDAHLAGAITEKEEAAVLLAIAGMFALSPDVRIEAGHRALALDGLSPPLRARHRAALFHNFLVAGRYEEGHEELAAARQAVEESHDDIASYIMVLAEAALEYVDGNYTTAVELTRRAARSPAAAEDPTRQRLGEEMRSESLMVTEHIDEALSVTDKGIADAQKGRQGWALHLLETWRGRQLFQLGRLDDAAPVLEGQLGPEEEDHLAGLLDAAGIVALGRTAIHRGDQAQRRRTVAMARAMISQGPPGYRRHAAWLLALDELAAARPHAAHDWLCGLGYEQRMSILPLFPADVTDDAQLVRIAMGAGDDELAKATVQAAEARAQANPTLAAVAGTANQARGLLDASIDHLTEATSDFERAARPVALASALEDLAAHQHRAGNRQASISALEQALRVAVEAGAIFDGRRLRAKLRCHGIRRRIAVPSTRPDTGWTAMTDSELAVARLVAQGLTNRDVATKLFISPHTVNSHLRQIFTKLEIKSRVELSRLANEQDQAS